jgi:hypothetical protein
MKVFFNGWFSGFLDNTNPGVHVNFFLELFKNVYCENCYIGNLEESEILCEFDMLLDCPQSYVKYKQWKQTYLFNGESIMRCNPNDYSVVLWGERNYKNIVNLPLFLSYIYSNNFIDKLSEPKKITLVPKENICVIISNNGGLMRNSFLNELEKHFDITFAGSYKNNIGGNIPYAYNTSEFLKFISKFKFIVSMENSINDTYITEKIIHGLLANIIPIYWGSKRICDYFNDERFLLFEDMNNIETLINKIKNLSVNEEKWLETVNKPIFKNNILNRTIFEVAKDIRCIINNDCWKNISQIYCINNKKFEPDRHIVLKNMFSQLNISDDYIKYISPTYKTTISKEVYNKYTFNQLVKYLRPNKPLTYGELSLFLNYRSVLEDIEKNYKDGLFLIFESDVMISKNIDKLNDFLEYICDKEFDIIHLGLFDKGIFDIRFADFPTGYRLEPHKISKDVLEYYKNNTINKSYIEDITNENSKFRIIRKFNTRCTDSFLWKYTGIVKFLNYMRSFEDYSSPFDYYMCNFFEQNINFKQYWSVDEFFKQGSNLGIIPSTLR